MICAVSLMFLGGVATVADIRTSKVVWQGECPIVWDAGGLRAVCGDGHLVPLSIDAKNVEKMLTGVELKCRVTSNVFYSSKGRCD